MSRLESQYQADLISKIEVLLPGCVILKNDSSYLQGVLDLLILHRKKWAMLEVKKDAKAKFRPNQPYYIDKFNKMSFAAAIYPENETEVLNDLESALQPRRNARVSKR